MQYRPLPLTYIFALCWTYLLPITEWFEKIMIENACLNRESKTQVQRYLMPLIVSANAWEAYS